MRVVTTLGSNPPVLSSQSKINAFCWHPKKNEALIACKASIMRVNGDTGGICGEIWNLSEEVYEFKQLKDKDEVITQLFCSEIKESDTVIVSALTSRNRMLSWEVSMDYDGKDSIKCLGFTKFRFSQSRTQLSETHGLKFAGFFGIPNKSQQIHLTMLSPARRKKKFGNHFAIEIKNNKKLVFHPTSLCLCPNIAVLAVGMADGSLQIWRFSEDEVTTKESDDPLVPSSFLISPATDNNNNNNSGKKKEIKNRVGCINWANHDETTKLIITHGMDQAEAVLWAWSAPFNDPSESGNLCCIRTFKTNAPNALIAIHPLLSVAICIYESEELSSTNLVLLDLEFGNVTPEGPVQFETRHKKKEARPPMQDRPAPPPLEEAAPENPKPEDLRKRRLFLLSRRFNSKEKNKELDISLPIPAEDSASDEEEELVEVDDWIHINPKTASVLITCASSLESFLLAAKTLILSFENSFQGSAIVPIVCFDSSQSCLTVRYRPQQLSNLPFDGKGSPLFESILERGSPFHKKGGEKESVLLKSPTSNVTIIGVSRRRSTEIDSQIIIRAVGSVALFPGFNYSRKAIFEPATDATFHSNNQIIVLSGKTIISVKRFDEVKQSWEKSSTKIELQLEARRIFSTPLQWGGNLALDSKNAKVAIYCGNHAVEFLCFSRNYLKKYDDEDLFMLVPDELRKNKPPPTPVIGLQKGNSLVLSVDQFDKSRNNIATRMSVALSVDEVDDALKNRDGDIQKKTKTIPLFLFERGEKLVNLLWSDFQQTELEGQIAVSTTRRIILLNRKLKPISEVRQVASSLAWVSSGTLAFTTLQSPNQVFNLSSAESFPSPLATVQTIQTGGPLVLVGSFKDSLVASRITLEKKDVIIVSRPLLSLSFRKHHMDTMDLSDSKLKNLNQEKSSLALSQRPQIPMTRARRFELACKVPLKNAVPEIKSMEMEFIRQDNPEFVLASECAKLFNANLAANDEVGIFLGLENSNDFWGSFRYAVSNLKEKPEMSKKSLLKLAKECRGVGSSALVEAIRLIVGDEVFDRDIETARLREDSAANLAAAAASFRSGEGSSRKSLQRRETLQHPPPSLATATLPMSVEGDIVLDQKTIVMAEVDDSVYAIRNPKSFEIFDVLHYYGTTEPHRKPDTDWDHQGGFDEIDNEEEVEDIRQREFTLKPSDSSARKFSFGGSDENACVGYWRFEEEIEQPLSTLDSSKCNNHGVMFGKYLFEDNAHSCSGLEVGGRRNPHSLKIERFGGMDVEISDSLNLGLQHHETSRQNFTFECWMRLVRYESPYSTIIQRISPNLADMWGVMIDCEGVLSFYSNSWGYHWKSKKKLDFLEGWCHIAISFTFSTEEGEIDQLKLRLYYNGQEVSCSRSSWNSQATSSKDKVDKDILRLGGNFSGEFLEVRFWAVERDPWEIDSGKETYLNLADRVPMKLKSSNSNTSLKSMASGSSSFLSPPPPTKSKTPTLSFSENFENSNPFGDDDEVVIKEKEEPKWNYHDPQAPKQSTKLSSEADPWVKVRDAESGADYFFNNITGESVWTDPRVNTDGNPWDEIMDSETGRPYYYNRYTGKTTWEKPQDMIADEVNLGNLGAIRERNEISENVEQMENEDEDGATDEDEDVI